MRPLWEITSQKVTTAIEKIIEVSHPRKVIIFGSYITGNIHRDSDLDILVVTDDDVSNPRYESVRIRKALKGILMSMDILVIPEKQLSFLAQVPDLIYREILTYGKVVYESKT